MENNYPYWFRLIDHWVNRKGKTGLTIPYVIGAYSVVTPNAKIHTVRTLFDEILNSDIPMPLSLTTCPTAGIVLGLRNDFILAPEGEIKDASGKTKIMVADAVKRYEDTWEKKLAAFENDFRTCLEEENFSYLLGRWQKYPPNELEFIKEAIG